MYFSKVRLYVYNLCATLMPVETGVWDNKERCIGSLWGDQHYELEYNCGRGVTAIYAPFQRRGRWGRVFEESIFCPRGEVGWVVSWVWCYRQEEDGVSGGSLFFVARLQDESLHGDCVTGMLPQPLNRIIIKALPTQCQHFIIYINLTIKGWCHKLHECPFTICTEPYSFVSLTMKHGSVGLKLRQWES